MDVQTYFFRRTNTNDGTGAARSWTDHRWHHACTRSTCSSTRRAARAVQAFGIEGPHHPNLGIAMDMAIGLKAASGPSAPVAVVQQRRAARHLFPLHLRQRHLHRPLRRPYDGKENKIDLSGVAVSNNGIELIDREFFLRDQGGPRAEFLVAQCLPGDAHLDRIEKIGFG